MEAVFNNQDYFISLDPAQNELARLAQEELSAFLDEPSEESKKKPKETQLLFAFAEYSDRRKRLTLLLDNSVTGDPDGMRLELLPQDADGWESVKTVSVRIAQRAYQLLQRQGSIGSRYGLGDKISITTQP